MVNPRTSVLLAALASAGCAYDWTIPDAPTDAGDGIDATVHDAAPDGSDAAEQHDAGSDVASPVDSGGADACAGLYAQLVSARSTAKFCQLGDCTDASVIDECRCRSWVSDPAHVGPFAAAIAAFEDAGCAPVGCTSCNPASGSCLAATNTCYP